MLKVNMVVEQNWSESNMAMSVIKEGTDCRDRASKNHAEQELGYGVKISLDFLLHLEDLS